MFVFEMLAEMLFPERKPSLIRPGPVVAGTEVAEPTLLWVIDLFVLSPVVFF
jgi:hypothetical protein